MPSMNEPHLLREEDNVFLAQMLAWLRSKNDWLPQLTHLGLPLMETSPKLEDKTQKQTPVYEVPCGLNPHKYMEWVEHVLWNGFE